MSTDAYRELICRLADETTDQDVPTLQDADLAVILRRDPQLFYDALADMDAHKKCTSDLENAAEWTVRTIALGNLLRVAIRTYVMPSVLRDVQAEREARAFVASLERRARGPYESLESQYGVERR